MSAHDQSSGIELLRVEVIHDRAGVTVFVVGVLDVVGSRQLKDCVDDVLAGRPMSVTIDASGVMFVDSSGIAGLLSARHAVMTEAGVPFRVVDPSPALWRLVEMTGFHKLLSGE